MPDMTTWLLRRPDREKYMRHDTIAQLQDIPGLAGLDKKELAALAKASVPTAVPAGTVLMTEGRAGKETFIVVEGSVAVQRNGATIAELGAGEFVGEMSVLDGGLRSATATCSTDCRLLVISVPDLRELLDHAPTLSRRLMVSLSTRLRDGAAGTKGVAR